MLILVRIFWRISQTLSPTALTAVILLFLSNSVTAEPLKILHIMSYHATWQWNMEQLAGFKAAFDGVDVQYRIVELDTKRNDNPEAIAVPVQQAKGLVASWQPDLIYTNDDNAQSYFSKDFINSEIPIVFSGVNRDPSEYDFIGAANITGILEQEHFVATVKLLQQLKPGIRKIAVLVDSDPTWKGVMARMRFNQRELPEIEISDWVLARSYREYQQNVLKLQQQVDALAILGVFNLKDEQGNNVDYETVLRWTTEHSQLPDFSFWQSRIERGTLCAVKVSGFEQGLQAGQLARRILLDNQPPSSLAIRTSIQGRPAISLARARKLGLKVDAELLLNTDVETRFAWDH